MAANHSNDDEKEMRPFGPWTVFNSLVTDKGTIKYDLNYFQAILYPPNESVLKNYLAFLIGVNLKVIISFNVPVHF